MLVKFFQILGASFILTITFTSASSQDDLYQNSSISCPTWYLPAENEDKCACGNIVHGKLRCLEDGHVSLLAGNCMTHTEDGQTLVGLCPYIVPNASILEDLYTTLPKNLSAVNQFMCGGLNRTGLLCSHCQDGLTLAAMSYHRKCIQCTSSDTRKGIVLFLLLAFLPTTVFFLIVMVCSINIASGPMNAVLITTQVQLAEVNLNPAVYVFKSSNPFSYYPVIFLLTFYGIWNLDFFRYVLPPFCISESLSNLQADALDYVIAVYPLLLIFVTYICVEMYDNKYRLLVILWEPFKRIFQAKCFKDLNVKYSLITTFATFLQLVYTRILFISKGILNYTYLTNATGDRVDTVLAKDASMTYLSSSHIPYVVLAIVMLLIFNMLPLALLLLYPTTCFQHLLGCFPKVNWHPVRAFMDIFHGCYKNGTEGTRDYRYFAGINFLMRIFLLLAIDSHTLSSIRLVLVPLIFSYTLASMWPYQRKVLNIWGTFCWFLYAVYQLWILCSTFDVNLSLSIVYVFHTIQFFYFCCLMFAKIMKTLFPICYSACVERTKLGFENLFAKNIFCCYRCFKRNMTDLEKGMLQENSCEGDEDFPDRLNNPQNYPPLLSVVDGSYNVASANQHRQAVVASYGIAQSIENCS